MAVSGIDIASFQPADYSTAGLGFVMVKATEGTGYVNPRHDAQVAHARAHHLVVGHYHFARPGSVRDQVAYFLRNAAPQPGDVLSLDWEDPDVSDEWKDAWIAAAKAAAAAHRVLLYCNRDFWLNRDHTDGCGDGLWIADPDAPAGHPRVQHPWLMHQYSEAGGLDRDVANFPTVAGLRAWAAGTTTPTITPEADMPLSDDDVQRIALAVQAYRNTDADAASVKATGKHIPDAYGYLVGTNHAVATLIAQLAGQTAAIQTLAAQLGQGRDVDTIVTAVQQAIADATVHVAVDVTGTTTTS